MIPNNFIQLLNEIDREIAAMSHEEYIKELLDTTGAWADLDNLTDEGFTGMSWGFERYQIGEQDDPELPV